MKALQKNRCIVEHVHIILLPSLLGGQADQPGRTRGGVAVSLFLRIRFNMSVCPSFWDHFLVAQLK